MVADDIYDRLSDQSKTWIGMRRHDLVEQLGKPTVDNGEWLGFKLEQGYSATVHIIGKVKSVQIWGPSGGSTGEGHLDSGESDRELSVDLADDVFSVLRHESPVVFGEVPPEVQDILDRIEAGGDAAVPHIISAIQLFAARTEDAPHWPEEAIQLCMVLGRIRTPAAEGALLRILKSDSDVFEFDHVRAQAAAQLAHFPNPALLSELTACLDLPNAPVMDIKKSMETLRDKLGTMAQSETPNKDASGQHGKKFWEFWKQ